MGPTRYDDGRSASLVATAITRRRGPLLIVLPVVVDDNRLAGPNHLGSMSCGIVLPAV